MERKEKKRWGHRILAVLLAFLMVAGVMPADSYGTNAYAAETAIQSTEEPAASSEEQQEPAVASGSTAEAEQEQPAPSAEPEKQPETSTLADDSGSSGSALDVTSRLVIDGGKEYVEAGEKFQLVISYNVPELGADQGNAYSGGVIQFTLPQYLHVARTEDGDYQIVGAEVTSTSYDDMANTYFVNLNDGGALASNQTNTVTVALETDNLITPDGTTLLLNGFQFQVSYIPSGSDDKDTLTIPVPSASTTVQAKADWQVQKEIISGDADVAYVRDGDYFEVTYQIKVSDEDGVNRLGRLGFEKYALTDVLPENLPEGGEAVEVKDVKIIHGNTEVSLAENTDYTLTRKDGAVTGITFTALDTMKEGDDLGQYMKIGDVTNTTYQYTVRYPYKPYTTPADQPKVTVYTLKNQATMEYTLYGESPEAGTAEASFDIAAYEEGVTVVDLAVEKMVSVGEEEAVLDKEQAAVYGEAAFTLFTDKDCKNVAYNTRGELMRDIAVGEAGKAEFSSIRYGTYYIKETKVPEGFAEAGVVKVVIDEDGKVYFGDDTKEDTDKTVTVTNVADSIGTLVFTKKGNSADGTKAEALSGVTFTLTGANGKNYTAKSAADGSVVFYNIPAGRYTLKETSLPQELLDEGYTLSDKEHDITIKANTINEPELDGDNIFLNESPKGYLTIRKVDAENEEQKLSGAVFAVYGPYDKEEAAEACKSRSDGFASGGYADDGKRRKHYIRPADGGVLCPSGKRSAGELYGRRAADSSGDETDDGNRHSRKRSPGPCPYYKTGQSRREQSGAGAGRSHLRDL